MKVTPSKEVVESTVPNEGRRALGKAAAALALSSGVLTSQAAVISGALPYTPNDDALPTPAAPGPLKFFSEREAATMRAITDRFIPADEMSVSGTEAGVVTFIDQQLAGPFGAAASQYRTGPFIPGMPEQGDQSSQTPADRYRIGLLGVDRYCQGKYGKPFASLSTAQQDEVLEGMEHAQVTLSGTDGKAFFELMLQNVREGFLADPIYGGNKNMVGWKMVGFPGARYDFRDVVDKRGQKLNIIPVSLVPSDS